MNEDDYRDLMEEPPGGHNHGRKSSNDPQHQGHHVELGTRQAQSAEFMRSEGFGVVESRQGSDRTGKTYGAKDAGMTTHRGVLHEGEYVDTTILQALVERHLGFTIAQVRAAYTNGRPTQEGRELRSRVDALLLDLQRKGGNMLALARVLVWNISEDKSCRMMTRALLRARQEEELRP